MTQTMEIHSIWTGDKTCEEHQTKNLLPLGRDAEQLSAQTLNYIKQQVNSGERKKGIVLGRIQELDRMISHLQNEKINLGASLHALGEKYGEN
jgi:hypothetical protein